MFVSKSDFRSAERHVGNGLLLSGMFLRFEFQRRAFIGFSDQCFQYGFKR